MRALRLGWGSARGGGRDGSRAAARAATAWENRWRCSSAGGGQAGRRDGGGGRRRAAQCVHCALAGVPRGAAVATVRGRRPARRRHGKTGGGIRAPAVARPGAATVAAADVELRNACIAPWLDVPRGAAVATVRGRRFAGGGPRGDGLGEPAAVFERWR
ncbi:hypothetical protein [Burkholderia gladioli]|uniref:hypothetical protein n=2 Tax=Burkholderia gladioli TaxID=28095 RepID=UPI001641FBA4|nr:hypothetical protein [Burkholderia gladioli]